MPNSLSILNCRGEGETYLMIIPEIDNFVFESIKRLFLRSTNKPNLDRKSAPMIGRFTSANIKEKIKSLRRPKSILSNFDPKVLIVVPLAAVSSKSEQDFDLEK